MEERLLLDGIALHAAHISPGNIQLSALIETDLANTQLAFRDRTAVAAGIAAHTLAVELLVQIALADVPSENVAERRHRKLPQLF
jgi:hypothetical protein